MVTKNQRREGLKGFTLWLRIRWEKGLHGDYRMILKIEKLNTINEEKIYQSESYGFELMYGVKFTYMIAYGSIV